MYYLSFINFFFAGGKSKASVTQDGKKKFERMLLDLSNEIPNAHVSKLGLILEFSLAEVKRYDQTNMRGPDVTSEGTLSMLHAWHMKTSAERKHEVLKEALVEAGLAALADTYLSR